jgi:hypothetical protein
MWRLCDLHVHTTPNEQDSDPLDAPRLVSESLDHGIHVIAVANHDHLRGIQEVMDAADGAGLDVIPGVEVTTDHGHLLVLAPGPKGLDAIAEFVNRAGIQESQPPRPFTDIVHLARNEHGPGSGPYAESLVLIPAHVDQAGSLLGPTQPQPVSSQVRLAESVDALEVVDAGILAQWKGGGVKGTGTQLPLLQGSDLHSPAGPRRPTWLYLPAIDASCMRHAFAIPEASIRVGAQPSSPAYLIESIRFEGGGGMHDGIAFEFSERMTALIGPPSSGKTLILDSLRFAFGLDCEIKEVAELSRKRLDRALGQGGRVLVSGRTPTGPFQVERVWGGAQPSETPFRPIVFSQGELVMRAMALTPSMALLDIHCPDAVGLKARRDEVRQDAREILSRSIQIAREAGELRSRVTNPEDGLDATRARIDGLGGTEQAARVANELARVMAWRSRTSDAVNRWLAEFEAPDGPELSPPPTTELLNTASLLPSSEVSAAVSEWKGRAAVDAKELAKKLLAILAEANSEIASLQAETERALGEAGFEAGSELLTQLGVLRGRLEELEGGNRRLVELEAQLDADIVQLRELVGQAEAARDALRQARRDTCTRVNSSISTFFSKIQPDADPSAIDSLLEEAKRGTYQWRQRLVDVRDRLDRSRLIEVAVRSTQGRDDLLPASASEFEDQDEIAKNAVSRDMIDQIADIATTWPEDLLGLLKRGTPPEPFDTLTEGMRALAIKEISFAASELPVISDQPEDAVPPQGVFENLVPTLRQQRSDRQFILASHDANIVVAGDVERIIVLRPGSEAASGMLFAKEIRDAAMDLLEGGSDAFELRGKRYGRP